jgi:Integrase core domain
MGIRDKPIAPASPWQNGFAERLIGSIRRECVDHIIVLGEAHLRQILQSYVRYTMTSGRIGLWTKMHQSLAKFSESETSNHTRHPWRTSPPLRPTLSFRYTQDRIGGQLAKERGEISCSKQPTLRRCVSPPAAALSFLSTLRLANAELVRSRGVICQRYPPLGCTDRYRP